MKRFKTIMAFVLAVVMTLAMSSIAVFAAGETTGTITVENATYGKEYKAYKIFDATYKADDPTKVSYTVDGDHKEFVDTTLFDVSTAADKNGNYSVSAKEGATETAILDWVKSNYSKFDSTGVTGVFDANNYTVKFEDVPFGYYYITSTLGSAVAINTNNPNVTVKDKNASAPTDPEKKITKVDGVAKDAVTEDAHVGSRVEFTITGNATNWTTSGTGNDVTSVANVEYAFEDTPTNLDVDMDTFTVKVNGQAIAKTAYTATLANGKLSVSIPLREGKVAEGKVLYPASQTEAGKEAYIPIEITYEATITAAAADAPATNEIGDEIVELDTYAFQVAKTDGSDPLPGAQFELWSNKGGDGDAAALTFVDNGDGTYTYSASGTVTTLDMTTNTTIVVKGLDKAWNYTLKEITVPDGYNQADDKAIAGTSLTKVEKNVDTTPASKALYKETVVNKQGAVLPSTGGIGTTIFYILGSLLVVGCGIVLVSRKRMQNNK